MKNKPLDKDKRFGKSLTDADIYKVIASTENANTKKQLHGFESL